MKSKVGDISRTFGQLMEFSNIEMPPAMALRLKRILATARTEVTHLSEVEQEQFKKFGGVLETKDALSWYKFESAEKQKECMAALEEVRNVEVELPGEKFREDEILTMSKVKAATLLDLGWLIAE